MSFISQHRLKISTLSPVHIGCSETFEPTNYTIDGDALYAFDSLSALAGLTENARIELLNIVSGKSGDHMLKQVQSFFFQHRESIIPNSSHIIPVHRDILEFYDKRIGKTVKSEGKSKNVINKLEIERTSFNPYNDSHFLPGSSIKGAIRTALLDSINRSNKLKNNYEKNMDLQQRLLKYETFERDPMRLMSIADAHLEKDTDTPLSDIRFAVNRKRKVKDKDGSQFVSMAESKGLNQILESIVPLHYQLFKTQLSLHKIGQELTPKYKNRIPDQSYQWTIEDIAEACNRFYFPLFNREIELLNELGYMEEDWAEKTQNILLNVLSGINKKRLFLMRIGRHSGAEAETLNGVRKIKIMTKDKNKPRFAKEPTTFWLASHSIDSKTNMIPFGWILVEINPQPESDLKKLFQNTENTRQKWLEEKKNFQQNLRDKIVKEQKEKDTFNNLPDEKKKLITLRELFQQKKEAKDNKAGGELANNLSNVLKQVEDWEESVRNEFIDLAEEIYDFIGWGKREKKEKRKSKLKTLRT